MFIRGMREHPVVSLFPNKQYGRSHEEIACDRTRLSSLRRCTKLCANATATGRLSVAGRVLQMRWRNCRRRGPSFHGHVQPDPGLGRRSLSRALYLSENRSAPTTLLDHPSLYLRHQEPAVRTQRRRWKRWATRAYLDWLEQRGMDLGCRWVPDPDYPWREPV